MQCRNKKRQQQLTARKTASGTKQAPDPEVRSQRDVEGAGRAEEGAGAALAGQRHAQPRGLEHEAGRVEAQAKGFRYHCHPGPVISSFSGSGTTDVPAGVRQRGLGAWNNCRRSGPRASSGNPGSRRLGGETGVYSETFLKFLFLSFFAVRHLRIDPKPQIPLDENYLTASPPPWCSRRVLHRGSLTT